MFLLALLFGLLSAARISAQSPSTAGFISIDCGLEDVSNYTSIIGLVFSSDKPYVSAGVNGKISPEDNLSNNSNVYATVRSFPDGKRNCYTLGPITAGAKYRVVAEFLYGNYDGLGRSPTFDLYLGVNFWVTMKVGKFNRAEIIFIAKIDSIQVCLVNTGKGTPFISELLLRPLKTSMYTLFDDSSHAIVFDDDRVNYGATGQIRFPDDIYDRIWFPPSPGNSVNTTRRVNLLNIAEFPTPQVVLQTASMALSRADSLNITTVAYADNGTYVYMYFADLQELGVNDSREITIFTENGLFFGPFRPRFLQEDVIYTKSPGLRGGLTYSIRATSNATVPPIINALEIFRIIKMPLLTTNEQEAKAIFELKKLLGVTRNWEGDPCVPRDFMWSGLECGYSPTNYSTITSLDLSSSRLSGEIPLFITNLTSLRSLDLSNNNFTGVIPSYLGELPTLKLLNLAGNNLSGPISQKIYERVQNGSLDLRINNNPVLCSTVDLCKATTGNRTKIIVPVAIGVSVAVLLMFVGIIVTCLLRRKKASHPPKAESNVSGNSSAIIPGGFHSESFQFSESDIVSITNNFERPIGRGGFGTVYHGYLKDGTPVAVKVLSKTSSQGEKQFRAEAELLTRVHHKYLVSLLGFCNESMALVYEFVPLGSLADRLSGNALDKNILSWNVRLRIALEAAQGLDYLHNGCKPPIVHRDVKTSNILLMENFQVKFADFGLSRAFDDEANTYAFTAIAGTPGYLDPEYQETCRLTEKSDVYSFGIVLLELVTGKPPISNGATRTHITKEVQSRIQRGDLGSVADPKMQGHYEVNSMWRVIEIALSCTSNSSSERPNMSEVAAQLRECLKTASSGASPPDSHTVPIRSEIWEDDARPFAR